MNDENVTPENAGDSREWHPEAWEDRHGRSPFAKWFDKLDDYDQAVVDTAIEKILVPFGIDIAATEWGKPLGDGLYEFRIRRSLSTLVNWGKAEEDWENLPAEKDKTVLLRIFCAFHGDRIILLFQGYDKGKDPSEKRQEREIKKARKYLRAWKNEG